MSTSRCAKPRTVLRGHSRHRAGDDGQVRQVTGRHYNLFDYSGHPEAERVIIIMGSGGEVVEETVTYLAKKGEKVGVLRARLYRPFSMEHFIKGCPRV
jgi:pyruvate-ferredoxin/flavodoxin oxidoreductase